MLWQGESGELRCRWDDLAQRVHYEAVWMQNASLAASGYHVPSFTMLSPFGGSHWYAS